MDPEVSREQSLRGSRPEGAADDVQPAGNTRQPEIESTQRHPLIPVEYGPVVGAVLTAAASLLIYSFNQIKQIDHRLDLLEQEARILLDGEGGIRPSREALQTYFHVEAIQRRLERLEQAKP